MLNVLGIRLMGTYGDIRQMDSFKYSKKRVNLVMDMNDIIEPGSLDLDDELYFLDKLKHDMVDYEIPRTKPLFFKGDGNVETPDRAMFIICKETVSGHFNTFGEFTSKKNELLRTFGIMFTEVVVKEVKTKQELLEAIVIPARFRLVALHGDKSKGVCCVDGTLQWNLFGHCLGQTGLLALLPCFSADAMLNEFEETSMPLLDLILPTSTAYPNKVNAVVATKGAGFHIDEGFRYADGKHVEIQRWAYIVMKVNEVGFRQAMNLAKEKTEANFHPRFANEILGHEVVRGYAGSI